MTEEELTDLFTEPNDTLKKVRKIIIKKLNDAILRENEIRSTKDQELLSVNALSYALYVVKDLIDHEGKILKSDLEEK